MRYGLITILVLVVATLCPHRSAVLAESAESVSADSALGVYLHSLSGEYEVPALAAAVVRSDGIVAASAVGLRRLDHEDTVVVTDCFHIGSITKSITALLTGVLIDEGKLNWNDRVTRFFPGLDKTCHPGYGKITVLDLLTHRAGLPPYTMGEMSYRFPEFEGSVEEKRRQFSDWHLQQEPHGTPGRSDYSNAGYVVVGAILEKVTGQSWESLVSDRLLEPLKLESAGFGRPALGDPDQPWGHWQRWRNETPTEPVAPDFRALPDVLAPSGDMHMSVIDFATYVQLHLSGLNNSDSPVIGSSDNTRLLFERLHKPEGKWASGWEIKTMMGHQVSYHGGSDGTFVAGMVVCRDQDLAVVVMANSSVDDAREATGKVLQYLLRSHSR